MGTRPLLALAIIVAGCAHTDPGEGDSPDGRRNDARESGGADGGPGIDAMLPKPDAAPIPDAQPVPDGALPSVDASTMLCGVPGPDSCAVAMDLTSGASAAGGVTVTGDTTGLADDLAPDALLCTGFFPDGPDAIYRLTAGAGKTITVAVAPMGWDVSVYIADACDSLSCLTGIDSGLSGAPETLSYTVPSAGTYYIIVDGWDPTASGCFQLSISL